MHDWLLLEIEVEWHSAELHIAFRDTDSSKQVIHATQFVSINIPRLCEWGYSGSINEVVIEQVESLEKLTINMQSGDQLVILASDFKLPNKLRKRELLCE